MRVLPDLKYDTEELRNSAKRYRETAEKLTQVKKELKKSISDLKNVYWKSTAGTAFQDMYEETWAVNVEKYAAVMKEMAGQLDKAAADYDDVTNKLKNIDGIDISG